MISLERFLNHFTPLFDGVFPAETEKYGAEQYVMLIDGIRDGRISDNAASAWIDACREVEADPEF